MATKKKVVKSKKATTKGKKTTPKKPASTTRKKVDVPEVCEMSRHEVVFYSPGTFVPEENTVPVDSWDIVETKKLARKVIQRYGSKPYGFRFFTYARTKKELDSKVIKKSPFYFLGGNIETIEDIKKRSPNSILYQSMKNNGWNTVITNNNNSYPMTVPFAKGDVLLPWDNGKD